jgi:hypothetical protein
MTRCSILLLVSCLAACARTPSPPPRATAPPAKTEGAAPVLRRVLPVPPAIVASADAREAVQVLGNAEAFGGAAKGYSGLPVPAVFALRTILAEESAAELLAVVLEHGTTPAQLMALSGLYYADHAAFERALPRFASSNEEVRVLEDGCGEDETKVRVRDLVRRDGAMRMHGPDETLAQWVQRNPNTSSLTYDIAGGGYPMALRGDGR